MTPTPLEQARERLAKECVPTLPYSEDQDFEQALVQKGDLRVILAALDERQAPDVELRLCESRFLYLKPDVLYRFTVDPNCEGCLKAEREARGESPTPEPSEPVGEAHEPLPVLTGGTITPVGLVWDIPIHLAPFSIGMRVGLVELSRPTTREP